MSRNYENNLNPRCDSGKCVLAGRFIMKVLYILKLVGQIMRKKIVQLINVYFDSDQNQFGPVEIVYSMKKFSNL